jgi:hypothetical protein
MSAQHELETLDQLQGGALSLKIIRMVYPDADHFLRGVYGLLKGGDVRLIENDMEVPDWRWRELFIDSSAIEKLDTMTLTLTEQGAKRIG